MTAPFVMIASPSYDSRFHVSYVKSLLATMLEFEQRGIQTLWHPRCGDSLLPMSRNRLVAEFMACPELTHLLWVDSDMLWQPDDILRLLSHDLPVVAGVYRRRGTEQMHHDYGELPGAELDRETGLLEVDSIGTGFLLTKKVVYERLAQAYPECQVTNGHGGYKCEGDTRGDVVYCDLFPLLLTAEGDYFAEDTSFCLLWRAIGGRIHVDVRLQLGHRTSVVLVGDPASMLMPPAAEAAAA